MKCEGAGIVSYGAYVPSFRVTTDTIARVWGRDGKSVAAGMGVKMKSVPNVDEDVITISVEAARQAVNRGGTKVNPEDIGAIYVGSESHPYAVKPTSTVVAAAIGASAHHTSADYEFACKAGTAAIQTCLGLVCSKMIKLGLAIGSDTSQGAPGDALEYSASAGGAGFLIGRTNGKDAEGEHGGPMIARITHSHSFTTDTPDFWRREGQSYPSHAGRFTGEPSYFRHVFECSEAIMKDAGTKPEEYDFLVLHQPNGKFPVRAAQKMGFKEEQYKTGLLTPIIGNTYSGSSMIGLAAVLDIAKPGQKILMVSYGSGAGSDGFHLEVTEGIDAVDRTDSPVAKMISKYREVDYAIYAKMRGKINMQD